MVMLCCPLKSLKFEMMKQASDSEECSTTTQYLNEFWDVGNLGTVSVLKCTEGAITSTRNRNN